MVIYETDSRAPRKRLSKPDRSSKLMLVRKLQKVIANLPKGQTVLVLGVGIDRFNDPSAGSPTETLLRLLLPLGGRV